MTRETLELEHFLSKIGAFVLIRPGEVIFDTRSEAPLEDVLDSFQDLDTSIDPWALFYYDQLTKVNRTMYLLIAKGYGEVDTKAVYESFNLYFKEELYKVMTMSKN